MVLHSNAQYPVGAVGTDWCLLAFVVIRLIQNLTERAKTKMEHIHLPWKEKHDEDREPKRSDPSHR
jgi:hypothetical protein